MENLKIEKTTREGNFGAWFINGIYCEYITEAHRAAEKILNTTIDYLDFKQFLLRR